LAYFLAMRELREADLRMVLDATVELAELDDLDELRSLATRALLRLIPSDSTQWGEGDPERGLLIDLVESHEATMSAELLAECQPYRHQHPIGCHRRRFHDLSALRVSDHISSSQLHRLDLYNICFPANGIEHQLSFAVRLSKTWDVAVACNRGIRSPDFSERDRCMLALLQPHVVAAYTRAQKRRRGRSVNHDLSKRELDVLGHTARGGTNSEIGQTLHISPRTVQKHLEHIYEKLGVRSRTEAAARWYVGSSDE
jgi:DNA-binding CsgD family transcriptional regulator